MRGESLKGRDAASRPREPPLTPTLSPRSGGRGSKSAGSQPGLLRSMYQFPSAPWRLSWAAGTVILPARPEPMSELPPTARSPVPPPIPRGGRPARPPRKRFRLFSRFGNALLGWEVLRAGRRTGTLAVGRTALGGLLLAAMWALYAASFANADATMTGSGTDIGKRLNRFAESFALTFFLVQATTVLLLTPVFVAGAIFEERETRSGEILLTTELTRREVYVGKLGARMVQVLLVVLAGMPILFLTQLWGGVSVEMILVDYMATGVAIIGAGVVTAAISAYAETLRAAILRTYGLLFLLDVLFFPASPFLVISMAYGHWIAGAVMLVVYVPMQARDRPGRVLHRPAVAADGHAPAKDPVADPGRHAAPVARRRRPAAAAARRLGRSPPVEGAEHRHPRRPPGRAASVRAPGPVARRPAGRDGPGPLAGHVAGGVPDGAALRRRGRRPVPGRARRRRRHPRPLGRPELRAASSSAGSSARSA